MGIVTKKILFIILYWLLNLTWGIIPSFIGFFAFLFAVLCRKGKIHPNGCFIIVEFGGNWGGVSFGYFTFTGGYSQNSPDWYDHTRKHEFGHTLQNAILGPFQIFLVDIPSICRYHYMRIERARGTKFSSDWYDSVWFEGTATKYGTKVIDWLEK